MAKGIQSIKISKTENAIHFYLLCLGPWDVESVFCDISDHAA